MLSPETLLFARGAQYFIQDNTYVLLQSCSLVVLTFFTKVGIGRDHTLFALAPGYVRFYRQKWLRGERKFVGLVMNRGEKLPRDEQALGRSRYFGKVDVKTYNTNPPPRPVGTASPSTAS